MREDNFIYGVHSVEEALCAEKEIDKLFIAKGNSSDAMRGIVREARQKNIPYLIVPPEKLDRITRKNHQGVICFYSAISFASLDNVVMNCFEQGENPLLLMLDGVTDVRNFGAIARTAECVGVNAIVIPFKGGAQVGPDALKTSSGALLHIPVCRVKSLEATLEFLQSSGIQVVTCTEKAKAPIYEADFSQPTVVVMGSEEKGIQPEVRAKADQELLIPMKGKINSLNVSVATSVILYEALRQRS
ncbi:MAG: 23S rRNA (guanosine(2251)-2'-O)-methyltransferase RlmB [Cyclobacteriaceae bacterium]